jgi:RNA polymerase sigma-70 factor (ECF subfamily)
MTEKIPRTTSNESIQEMDEASLVAEAKRNPEAFESLYARYVQPVFRYLCNRVGSVPEAEDITAQTFLAALEGFDRYRDNGHFAAWLFSIARHKAMDHFRQQHKQASLESADFIALEAERISLASDSFSSGADPLQQVIQTERVAALAKLIRALAEEERDLLRLRFVADLPFSEIGRLLGRSEDAVKKALYRLLVRLQSQLEVSHD